MREIFNEANFVGTGFIMYMYLWERRIKPPNYVWLQYSKLFQKESSSGEWNPVEEAEQKTTARRNDSIELGQHTKSIIQQKDVCQFLEARREWGELTISIRLWENRKEIRKWY